MNIRIQPLYKWPGTPTPPAEQKDSPFFAKYDQTLGTLQRELVHLEAKNVIIQAYFLPTQLGANGWPKGGQQPSKPGVVLTFSDDQGNSYSYPCDTFTWWTANLRAIALALEALRKIDRYGVTRSGQQYAGFRALPPPPETTPPMSPEEAAQVVAGYVSGVPWEALLEDRDYFESMYKLGKRRAHTDAGGSDDAFIRLTDAAAVLRIYFEGNQQSGAAGT